MGEGLLRTHTVFLVVLYYITLHLIVSLLL